MWPPQQILQQQILQRLPTFRRDNDYSDEADPYKASLKHTLKLYRYHANREESEFNGWKHVDVDKRKRAVEHPSIKIVSWNIDFEAHNVVERATAALKYLKEERFGCKLDTDSPGPCVIMLQEVHAKALRDAIRTNEWVRHNFFITPVDHLKWPKIWMHGNVTLVERSVAVRDAYCLEYGLSDQTRMAVVLNITLRSADKLRHVTLINTQLDDLPGLERHRRRQLRECAKVLEGSESGGIIAGGMSIYSSEDDVGEELLRELKLYDTGGCDDSDKSLTWGFQGGRGSTKSRPDKIMSYTPPNHRRKLLVTPPKRLGMGLKWYPGNTFVSDHYGLMATVENAAAARASNAIFHPSYVPVGVFVGGTSGVGEAMVKAIASHLGGNIHLIIVGRNRSAAEKTFASIPRPTGEDGKPVRRDFIYCDAFLMRNIKATCVELSERLTKVNFLVLSAGYFEVTSRKETEEGLDKMVVMRYYNRFKFTLELLPLLKNARALGEEANAMSILGPAPFTVKINIDDLDMKKSYGAFRAAIHTGVYNDIMVEQFSKRHPEVTFTHIYPGIVNTPAVAHTWAAWWPLIVLRPLIGVLMYFFGETAEASAEYMLYGLLHAKKGWYRRNNHGDDSGVENFGHTEEEKLAVWNHSCSITDV